MQWAVRGNQQTPLGETAHQQTQRETVAANIGWVAAGHTLA